MTARADVVAVLVNYRSADDVTARLASGALDGMTTVVVDNASEPEAVLAACREHGARSLLLDSNVGFAAGVNAAVRSAASRPGAWLLLNPDAEVTRDQLDALLARFDGAGADAVGPLLVGVDGGIQVGTAGAHPTPARVAAHTLGLSTLLPRVRGVFLTRRQLARGGRVDWLCAACLLVAGDAFERFGALPEDEVVYAEDVAWGSAATTAGAQLLLAADIEVVHRQGASGGSAAWRGALVRLVARRHGRVGGVLASTCFTIGLGLRRVLRALRLH